MGVDVDGVVVDVVAVHNHHGVAVHGDVAVRVDGADSDRRRPGQTFITLLFDRGDCFSTFRSFTNFQAFSELQQFVTQSSHKILTSKVPLRIFLRDPTHAKLLNAHAKFCTSFFPSQK